MSRRVAFFGLALGAIAACSLPSCFYDFAFPRDGGDGGDAGDGGGVEVGGERDGSILPEREGGGTDGDAGLPDGPPAPCRKSGECAAGLYCRFDDHLCGRGQANGVCTPVPTPASCSKNPAYYCGCNGVQGKTDCQLFEQGLDLDVQGCPVFDPNTFRCGYELCLRNQSFCQQFKGSPPVFNCADWSSLVCAGGVRDCACAKPACTMTSCDPGDGGSGSDVTAFCF